jgi:hypothetical protein
MHKEARDCLCMHSNRVILVLKFSCLIRFPLSSYQFFAFDDRSVFFDVSGMVQWMAAVGFIHKPRQKHYFVDVHEKPDTLAEDTKFMDYIPGVLCLCLEWHRDAECVDFS